MRIKICLKYSQEPELVALRFNPGISMPGLTKQILRAHINGHDFQIHLQKNVEYVKKALYFYLALDDEVDMDIISFLNSLCASAPAYIRNLLLRSLDGNVDDVYKDIKLRKLALDDSEQDENRKEDVLLSAIMKLESSIE